MIHIKLCTKFYNIKVIRKGKIDRYKYYLQDYLYNDIVLLYSMKVSAKFSNAFIESACLLTIVNIVYVNSCY